MNIKNFKWVEIIDDESEIVKNSAAYIIPLDENSCKIIIVDDDGERRVLNFSTGSGSDSNYVHKQLIPSSIWIIQHNLGKRGSIITTDEHGNKIDGSVVYVDNNKINVYHAESRIGFAYIN